MQIWSHRGNPGPENSLAAFDAAHKIGVRNFETDIQVTKDGVIVLAHDPHTGRVAQQKLIISQIDFAQLNEATNKIAAHEPWGTLD
jgi:glycerophosphoryl diester phosphodiesterase